MATKKAATTAVTNYDEELAAQAQVAAGMEASTASGQFFGLQSGVLTYNDAPLPNNEMAVIILDGILENVFYEGAYDPQTPQSPMCFAFGRDEATMAPHELVVAAGNQQCGASGQCRGCDKNEFGSADIGKGKACRNTRRLAMISAGTLEQQVRNGPTMFQAYDDLAYFETAPIGYMKLPVMSVKGYAGFVKQVAGAMSRPPHGIFTKVRVVPDPKSQFRVLFEPLGAIPGELMGAIMARHREAVDAIEFPYTPAEERAAPVKKAGARAVAPGKGKKY